MYQEILFTLKSSFERIWNQISRTKCREVRAI